MRRSDDDVGSNQAVFAEAAARVVLLDRQLGCRFLELVIPLLHEVVVDQDDCRLGPKGSRLLLELVG